MVFVAGSAALGLELTDDAIKLSEVRMKGRGGARVLNFHAEPLPEGVMYDGHVQDAEALEAALAAALKARRWGTRRLHFALPSQIVMVRMLKLPLVAEGKLKRLIDFEVKHNLHMPFDDPTYDYIRLPFRADAAPAPLPADDPAALEAAAASGTEIVAGPMCEVMLAAASRAVLAGYEAMFRRLKLRPLSMELKAFSLMRLHERAGFRSKGVRLMADMNRRGCELAIVDDGYIKIARNVEARFNEAEPGAGNAGGMARELAAEMERLMNFYRYTLGNRDHLFEAVVVTGDVAGDAGLIEALKAYLDVDMIVFQWEGLDVRRPKRDWDLASFAASVGLSLRGKRA